MGEITERIFYKVGRLVLVFLLLGAAQLAIAQGNTQVFIQGNVVGADSLEALPYVHIRGQQGTMGTAADGQGYFSVNVLKYDTIMFSSVGYEPYFLVPADSVEDILKDLTVVMVPQINTLKEITIKAYDNIEQFIRREPEPFSLNRSKGEPLFERKEPREVPAIGLAGGMNGARLEGAVTAFANLFNSQYQQEKKLREILANKEKEAQQQQLQQMMTEKYQAMLALATNLSEADIERFTLEHMPPPQVMLRLDDYSIMLSIVKNLEYFETDNERQLAIQRLLKTKQFEGSESTTRQ
ncbi:MAG: carboxypeptidase-like regulatory domain-containing protein [Bacteroidota bacterium]